MRLAKIFYVFTCALALFPLLKLNHFSILMIIWFVLALINTFKNKGFVHFKSQTAPFLVLSFFCLMYVFYLPFVQNFTEIGKSITKSLPFVIFPLGFLLNKDIITHKLLKHFSVVFIAAVILLNTLGWVSVFYFGWNKAWQLNDFYHPVFRTLFANATLLHLPYLGLLSVFAALWLTLKMFLNKKVNILSGCLIAFLLLSIYIYSARMALVCYLIGLLFIIFKSIKKQILRIMLLVTLPLTALVLFWFSPMKERYVKVVEKELVLPNKNQLPHEVNYRYGIWYCSFNIAKEHFFTGVGADKVQQSLNNCYSTFTYKSYEDFNKQIYNTHNQYVDQLLKFGFFGLILFVGVLFYYFYKASVLYQTFVLITAISFLTENILDRQIGVVFVALLNTIFVIYKLNTVEKSISSRLVR